MALSFHYSATVKSTSALADLVCEVTDIGHALGWQFVVIADPALMGVIIEPPNCQPLALCFTAEGKTLGVEVSNACSDGVKLSSTIQVKTQHAGPEIHKAVIDILTYLNRKYFQEI